jgi:hypothetical protein
MCLNQGARPSLAEFKTRVHHRNLDHLTIWHNVGSDVDQGLWAMAGARQGTYMTMLTEWDYREVQDFDALHKIWNPNGDPTEIIQRTAEPLQQQLDLSMVFLYPEQSQFFKHHYRSNWHNCGVMTREIDVIREQEGW